MYDMLKKLAKKSKARELSPAEVDAKSSVLHHLIGDMNDMMGDKLKKVTVASDSPEGMEEGLKKAHELLSQAHSDEDEGSEEEHEDGIRRDSSPEEQEEHQEDGSSDLDDEHEEMEDEDHDLADAEHDESGDESDMKEKLKKLKALKEKKY